MRTAEKNGLFVGECLKNDIETLDGESLVDYQIRFINDRDFLVEAVCPGFEFDPMEITNMTLPPLVSKQINDSGLSWQDLDGTSLTVTVLADWQRWFDKHISWHLPLQVNKKIALVNKQLIYPGAAEVFNAGPVTSCSGYGYQCCDLTSQVGMGGSPAVVTDCRESCFAQCGSRPVLLSFNSEPYMDTTQRILQINRGEEVTFNWVGDNLARSQLDFGDGKAQDFSADEITASHSYSCERAKCSYTVVLTLFDDQGNTSINSSISKVQVEVF